MPDAVPLSLTTTETLPTLPPDQRRAMLEGPTGLDVHATLFAELAHLGHVEHRAKTDLPAAGPGSMRVVSWNAERCKFLAPSRAMLEAEHADVYLLSEMDHGMARARQFHTTRELADAFRCDYAYAIEFLELGLGGEEERERHAGEENAVGYHGGGILSRFTLQRPAVVRLECGGEWFLADSRERRVGGRIAVLGTVSLDATPVTFAAIHLESESSPQERADQMQVLFDAIEAYGPGSPTLIGGDLNTFSLSVHDMMHGERFATALSEDPDRITHPVPHEPLFPLAESLGYDWRTCNVIGEPTVRSTSPPPSARGVQKIDWFLARGLTCAQASVIPAVDPDTGRALSDHEALGVTIALP